MTGNDLAGANYTMPDKRLQLGQLGQLGAAAVAAVSVARSCYTLQQARHLVPLAEADDHRIDPPLITVIVPARNEESVIDGCLSSLRAQTYPSLQIIMVDDGSTDRTAEIADRHAAEDSRVQVVRVQGPPAGWTGKVHAMHAGVEAAPARAPWLLFVDADTVVSPELVSRLLTTAESVDADLVSTPGTAPTNHSATWPLLLPPGLQLIGEHASPDGNGRRAFAIGHCILVRWIYFDKMGGWAALADRRNEDVAIATAIRDQGGRTRVIDNHGLVTTLGMDPLAEGWASLRKSFVAGLHGSPGRLVSLGVVQLIAGLTPPAAIAAGLRQRRPALVALGAIGWAAQSVAYRRTARLMQVRGSAAVAAPLATSSFGTMLLDGARRSLRGRMTWKGRPSKF